MTLADFIKKNRVDIDICIKIMCPNIGRLNNETREGWIMNDEGMYNWWKGAK